MAFFSAQTHSQFLSLLSFMIYIISTIHTNSQMSSTEMDIERYFSTAMDPDDGGGGSKAGDLAADIAECLELGIDIIDARHNDTCFATMVGIVVIVVVISVCCCFFCLQHCRDRQDAAKRAKRQKKRAAQRANANNKQREKQIQMQSGRVAVNSYQIQPQRQQQQQQPAEPVYTDVVK